MGSMRDEEGDTDPRRTKIDLGDGKAGIQGMLAGGLGTLRRDPVRADLLTGE
jgi:hypothetical protein